MPKVSTPPRRERQRSQRAKTAATLRIERRRLAAGHEHPQNPRKHPEPGSPEWEALAASLEYDYFDPIVYNERNDMYVSGHLRRKIYLSKGYVEADMVIVNYDEDTHVARMIAANKLQGTNDEERMASLFGGLASIEGFNLSLTGFTLPEIGAYGIELPALYHDGGAIGEGIDSEAEGEGRKHAFTEEEKTHLRNLMTEIGEPDIEAEEGKCYQLGEHFLFVGSMITPPFSWADKLTELRATVGPDRLRFIPVPDPYVALTDKDLVLVMVQPDVLVASYILTNYSRIKGDVFEVEA